MHQTAYFPNKMLKNFPRRVIAPSPDATLLERRYPSQPTLSPQKKKGKVGAYDNLILYQEHALKKALILLCGFIDFIVLTILELLALVI